jgi:hypothetical protein
MPGRTEVNALHRSHADRRRRLARLEERLAEAGAGPRADPDAPARDAAGDARRAPAKPRAKKPPARAQSVRARGEFADRLAAARASRRTSKEKR